MKNDRSEWRLASWEPSKTTRLFIGGKVIAQKVHWNLVLADSESLEEPRM